MVIHLNTIALLCTLAIWQVMAQTPCNPNICVNGGFCLIILGNPSCACPAGYTGSLCEKSVSTTPAPSNLCESSPCLNGGACIATADNFICVCPNTYTGARCQIPLTQTTKPTTPPTTTTTPAPTTPPTTTTTSAPTTPAPTTPAPNKCSTRPCLNSGLCIPSDDNYVCICPNTHTGAVCQTAVDLSPTLPATDTSKCPASKIDKFNIGCDPAEVVFLIEYARTDTGQSVDHEGDFIKELIDEWRVDDTHVRIGVVVYHDTVTESIHIDDYRNDNQGLKNRISEITRNLRPSGEADLAKALDYVRTTSFTGSRPGVQKIVQPIVHQMSDSTKDKIAPAAQKLKDQCVVILGSGVRGSTFDQGILAQAVSQPSSSYYQEYSSYTAMEAAAKYFYNLNCRN